MSAHQIPAGKVCPNCENKVGILCLNLEWDISHFGKRHEKRTEFCPACGARWTLDVTTYPKQQSVPQGELTTAKEPHE